MITRMVSLDLTPAELAQVLAEMPSEEQAEFFNELAIATSDYGGLGWCGQCAYIVEDLTDSGRRVIETIAGHVLAKDAA